MYLLSDSVPEEYRKDRPSGHSLWEKVLENDKGRMDDAVLFVFNAEGLSLLKEWFAAPSDADKPITGVLCDWLQDHRDLLLSGAVGPNPAERLEQVIEWFRQHFERGSYAHT